MEHKKEVMQRFVSDLFENFGKWLYSLSDRTLTLSSIVVLHSVFVMQMYAYLTRISDRLPSLDTYLMVVFALVILNLRAILNKDQLASMIHMLGFVSQLALMTWVVLK